MNCWVTKALLKKKPKPSAGINKTDQPENFLTPEAEFIISKRIETDKTSEKAADMFTLY